MPYDAMKSDERLQKKVDEMGYEPTKEGLALLVKEQLHKMNMGQLCRVLGVNRGFIRGIMKQYDIKNPNKSGGANNPWGIKGKAGQHRCRFEGVK